MRGRMIVPGWYPLYTPASEVRGRESGLQRRLLYAIGRFEGNTFQFRRNVGRDCWQHHLLLADFPKLKYAQAHNYSIYMSPYTSGYYGAVPTEEPGGMISGRGAQDGLHHIQGRSSAENLLKRRRKSTTAMNLAGLLIFRDTLIHKRLEHVQKTGYELGLSKEPSSNGVFSSIRLSIDTNPRATSDNFRKCTGYQ